MSEQIDVLAVMDDVAHALHSTRSAPERIELLEARAAVAELIAAAVDAVERGTDSPIHMRLEAALSLVQGGSP